MVNEARQVGVQNLLGNIQLARIMNGIFDDAKEEWLIDYTSAQYSLMVVVQLYTIQ